MGVYAFYWVTMGVLAILVGKFSDHHSKKYLMAIGYAPNAARMLISKGMMIIGRGEIIKTSLIKHK